MTNKQLASMIDHTLLRADATKEDIKKLCAEAIEYGFASVCVNPCYVKLASLLLVDTKVKTCTVVGYPLGANTTEVKVFETKRAIRDGAQEIDVVMNIGFGLDQYFDDIRKVIKAAKSMSVKVIIETSYLTNYGKRFLSFIFKSLGAAFVKTCTGFNGSVTVDDIERIREAVGPEMGIKASGGIKTREDAMKMIKAGATRIGTSSAIEIMKGNSHV